jgi:hypothetical protein
MLYLIGGVSRSGKTLLAQKMVRKKRIPYYSLDALISTLTSAVPELGIHYDLPFIGKAEKAWSFTRETLGYFHYEEESYVAEGDCILPHQIAELMKEKSKDIRCCFMGYSLTSPTEKLELVRKHAIRKNDWTYEYDDCELLEKIVNFIEYSSFLKEECAKYNIAYFDVSQDFLKAQKRAYDYLNK